MRHFAGFVVYTLLLSAAGCKVRATPERQEHTSTTAPSEPPPAAPSPSAGPAAVATAIQAAPGEPVRPGDIPPPADAAAPPKEAQKTASGLASMVLTKGAGKDRPKDADRVKVHYTGWTKSGRMFDSSVQRNEPTVFGVTQVIPGWTEALKLMVQGEKRRIWIPGKLAYGDTPAQLGAPAGDLVFDVELLEIIAPTPPPTVPEDVKAPPKTATKTASGLAYRILQKGTGKDHPTATSRVTVHYTGWTQDGKMFDSSVVRGEPISFPLTAVIKGWTEGVQLMVVGEKTRFWIPADLAYGDKPMRPGAPSGPLVFDVELISIH